MAPSPDLDALATTFYGTCHAPILFSRKTSLKYFDKLFGFRPEIFDSCVGHTALKRPVGILVFHRHMTHDHGSKLPTSPDTNFGRVEATLFTGIAVEIIKTSISDRVGTLWRQV